MIKKVHPLALEHGPKNRSINSGNFDITLINGQCYV